MSIKKTVCFYLKKKKLEGCHLVDGVKNVRGRSRKVGTTATCYMTAGQPRTRRHSLGTRFIRKAVSRARKDPGIGVASDGPTEASRCLSQPCAALASYCFLGASPSSSTHQVGNTTPYYAKCL